MSALRNGKQLSAGGTAASPDAAELRAGQTNVRRLAAVRQAISRAEAEARAGIVQEARAAAELRLQAAAQRRVDAERAAVRQQGLRAAREAEIVAATERALLEEQAVQAAHERAEAARTAAAAVAARLAAEQQERQAQLARFAAERALRERADACRAAHARETGRVRSQLAQLVATEIAGRRQRGRERVQRVLLAAAAILAVVTLAGFFVPGQPAHDSAARATVRHGDAADADELTRLAAPTAGIVLAQPAGATGPETAFTLRLEPDLARHRGAIRAAR